MRFEWDASKATANRKKHRITFDEALTVFRDPLAVIFGDEAHSSAEKREIIIGHSDRNRLLLVCFTERAIEVVRIFSARRSTKKEQADYEEKSRF